MAAVPLRERCVWGAVCAEAVTRLYSEHFQRVFDTNTAFTLVWSAIGSGEADREAVKRYLRQCARRGKSDEAYAYGLPNGMLAALVAETLDAAGAAAVECVGYGARLYPNVSFFRHGIDDRVAGFNPKHIEALIEEYHRFSRSVCDSVTRHGGGHRREEYQMRFALDPGVVTLPSDLFTSEAPPTVWSAARVPEHEIIR